MTYIGNLMIYTICILCIFMTGLNKKSGKKVVVFSIVTAAGSLLLQVGCDFLANMVIYMLSDDNELYSAGAILLDIFNFTIPILTVFVISKITDCASKSKVILVILCLCLLASVYIEYGEFINYTNSIKPENGIYDAVATERDLKIMATSQEIFNKIPPGAYIFAMWVNAPKKKEEK